MPVVTRSQAKLASLEQVEPLSPKPQKNPFVPKSPESCVDIVDALGLAKRGLDTISRDPSRKYRIVITAYEYLQLCPDKNSPMYHQWAIAPDG